MSREPKLFNDGKTERYDLKDYLMYRHRGCEKEPKDFNSYTETGFYSWADTKVLLKCKNRPCDELGMLVVKNNESTENPIIYHRYVADNGDVFLDVCISGVWGGWVEQATKAEVDDVSDRLAYIEKNGISSGDTLPIGSQVVWNDDEPIPTGWSEVSYVDPELYSKKSLLINGDFQVNQRGLSEYLPSANVVTLTLDMWKANAMDSTSNSKVIVNDDGTVTIENNQSSDLWFLQTFDEKTLYDYTISVNVIEVSNPQTAVYFEGYSSNVKHLEVGLNNFTLNCKPKGVVFIVKANSTLTLEYVDLFEGDVVYKHVKEDKATALMRCQQFLQLVEYSCSNYCTTEQTQSIFEFPIVKMCRIPMITVLSTNSISGIDEISIVEEYSNGSIWVGYRLKVSGFLRINKRKLLLSCEPV